MNKSTNFNMNLPELGDQYNLNDWNENTQILDTQLGNLSSHVSDSNNPHQVGGSQLSSQVPTEKISDGAITLDKLASELFDSKPTQNSNNLVKSKDLYSALCVPKLGTCTNGTNKAILDSNFEPAYGFVSDIPLTKRIISAIMTQSYGREGDVIRTIVHPFRSEYYNYWCFMRDDIIMSSSNYNFISINYTYYD